MKSFDAGADSVCMSDDRIEHPPHKHPRYSKYPRQPTSRSGNQLMTTDLDKDDIAMLQAENSMLRQRLTEMEAQFAEVEQRQIAEQSDALDEINELLKMAEVAKNEATSFNHNTARDKMRRDIQMLQTILKKAKAERNEFKKTIKQSEEKLRLEIEKKKEEGLKNEIDQEIFTRIIKEDRDKNRAHVVELVERIKTLEKEKYEVFLWAKHNQEHYISEMRKLTRALAKMKRLSDDSVHDAKVVFEATNQLKDVVLSEAVFDDDLPFPPSKEDDNRQAESI